MKPGITINIGLKNELYDQVDKLKELYNGGQLTKEQLLDNIRLFVVDNLDIDLIVRDEDEIEEKKEIERKKRWLDFWKK